ncbi:MAG: TraR/DksA C4-type zinc finger protein [Thermoanaerobaculia bacterium]
MTDTTTMKARLEGDRERVQARIAAIQGAERKETSDGQTDNAHLWEDADIRDGDLDEAVDELGEIDNALQRIDLGSYGVCATCGEPIPDARLEVMPYAVKCVNCAES